MLTRAEFAVAPVASSSSRAATELAGNGEGWRELSAEQRGPRELPTTEFKMVPTTHRVICEQVLIKEIVVLLSK